MNTRHTDVLGAGWLDLYYHEHIDGGVDDKDSIYIHVQTTNTLAEVSYHTTPYLLDVMHCVCCILYYIILNYIMFILCLLHVFYGVSLLRARDAVTECATDFCRRRNRQRTAEHPDTVVGAALAARKDAPLGRRSEGGHAWAARAKAC